MATQSSSKSTTPREKTALASVVSAETTAPASAMLKSKKKSHSTAKPLAESKHTFVYDDIVGTMDKNLDHQPQGVNESSGSLGSTDGIHASNTSVNMGNAVATQPVSAKKKRKKKSKSRNGNEVSTTNDTRWLGDNTAAMRNTAADDGIWSSSASGDAEPQKIRDFWLQLSEEERRSLVKVEKDAVMQKMKERQKNSCNCSVCGKKRMAIEDELERLYEAYYVELEQYANHQRQHISYYTAGNSLQSSAGYKASDLNGKDEYSGRVTLHNCEYDDDDEEDKDDDDDDFDGTYGDDDIDEDIGSRSDQSDILSDSRSSYETNAPFSAQDLNHSTSSLDHFGHESNPGVKNGILAVADDLLKNDGAKFLEMMERLAERRMQKEEELSRQSDEYYQVDEDDDDDDQFDDDDEEDDKAAEERMVEGKQMFQLFAARMFEQRVRSAYRERIAEERQRRLIQEIEEEARQRHEKALRKQQERERKRDMKRQAKMKQEEERLANEAKRKAEEEAARAERERLERQKREQERARKEEERRQREEERARKEEEKRRKLKEERERAAEKERKRKQKEEEERREREQQERQKREEAAKRKEKEEERRKREEKEREQRERRKREEAEKEKAKEMARIQSEKESTAQSNSGQTTSTSAASATRNSPSQLRTDTTASHTDQAVRQKMLMDTLIGSSHVPIVGAADVTPPSHPSLPLNGYPNVDMTPLARVPDQAAVMAASPSQSILSTSTDRGILPIGFGRSTSSFDASSNIKAVDRMGHPLTPIGQLPSSRPSTTASPIGIPVGLRSNETYTEDTDLSAIQQRLANSSISTQSYFNNFLFGEPNRGESRYSWAGSRCEDASVGWNNGWTASTVLSDNAHGNLFGDVLADRSAAIVERAKIAYQKLGEITQSAYYMNPPQFHTLIQLHQMMRDMYYDMPIELHELYVAINSPNSGFQCVNHAQHGYLVRCDVSSRARVAPGLVGMPATNFVPPQSSLPSIAPIQPQSLHPPTRLTPPSMHRLSTPTPLMEHPLQEQLRDNPDHFGGLS